MILVLPVTIRAILIAASLASVPEVVKKYLVGAWARPRQAAWPVGRVLPSRNPDRCRPDFQLVFESPELPRDFCAPRSRT